MFDEIFVKEKMFRGFTCDSYLHRFMFSAVFSVPNLILRVNIFSIAR
jgi:hypothetical protein